MIFMITFFSKVNPIFIFFFKFAIHVFCNIKPFQTFSGTFSQSSSQTNSVFLTKILYYQAKFCLVYLLNYDNYFKGISSSY